MYSLTMKKWAGLGIGLLVSLGIFILLIGEDIDAVKRELTNARYGYAIPFVMLHILGIYTRSRRWYVLLDRQIPPHHSFQIISVGYFLSGILPFRLGDFARAWMTTRLRYPIAGFTSLSTIVVERLMDLLAVICLLGLTLLFLEVPQEVSLIGALMGIVGLIGLFGIGLFAAKSTWAYAIVGIVVKLFPIFKRLDIETRLTNFLAGIQPLSRFSITIQVILWTIISWSISVTGGYIILFMMFDAPTLGAAFALTLFTALSVALPAVPGNLGPFEGATVGALWIAGLINAVTAPENAAGVALGTLLHALSLGSYILLGVYGLYAEHASFKQIRAAALDLREHDPLTTEKASLKMEKQRERNHDLTRESTTSESIP